MGLFFTCVSDGYGNVRHFLSEDVERIKNEGFDVNQHAYLFKYLNIPPVHQHKWNLWEFEPETKIFTKKYIHRHDDVEAVYSYLVSYFKDKDVSALRELFKTV